MKSTKMSTIVVLALGLMVCLAQVSQAAPMGTAITYQGRLMDKNKPADGLYDLEFKLYDSNDPCTGTQLASPIDINDVDVIDGHFVVDLDFGSDVFDGNSVWLETRVVRSPMGSDPATLSPLVELTPTPYALYAETAGGDNDWRVTGDDMYAIPSGNVGIGTKNPDARLTVKGAILRDGSKMCGKNSYTHINLGTTSTTGKSGYDYSYATVGGGENNTASNEYATVPGGYENAAGGWYSFAAGRRAKANHEGTFVWADSTDADFASTDKNQFLIRALGGVGIGTTSPGAKLDVEGDGTNTPLELDGKGMPDYARAVRVTNTGMADGTNMNFNIGKTDVFGQTGEITYYHAGDADPDNMLSLGLWGPGKILNMTYAGNVGIGTTNPVSKLEVNGRLELPGNDASGTAGTGVIEIGNSLRLDDNEIITNTDETLYIQRDNNGDLSVDNGTLIVDASANKVGIGTPAYHGKLEVNGEISTGHGGLRWKLFSGTGGGTNITFSHGLDASKIFSISCVLLDGDSGTGIAQEYQEGQDLLSAFRVTFDDNEAWIKCSNYYNDPDDKYRCIVWYIDS